MLGDPQGAQPGRDDVQPVRRNVEETKGRATGRAESGANEARRTPQNLSAKAHDSVVPQGRSVRSPFREANSESCRLVYLSRRKEPRPPHATRRIQPLKSSLTI